MKKSYRVITMVLLAAGLLLVFIPLFRRMEARNAAKQRISAYTEAVAETDPAAVTSMLDKARAYNKNLDTSLDLTPLSSAEEKTYESLLDVSGTGIMGYVDIPKANIHLPIYHGTSAAVLAKGAGHLDMSSLPVGGEGSHSVITGHTGLDGSPLFDNLTKLSLGDTFTVTVLNEKRTYTVDRIETILPTDTTVLAREPEEDLTTLVTCTPAGVNDKRLCVRGKCTSAQEIKPASPRTAHPAKTGDTWMIYIILLLTVLSGEAVLFLAVSLKKGIDGNDPK